MSFKFNPLTGNFDIDSDEKVKVAADDFTAGYLQQKILADSGIDVYRSGDTLRIKNIATAASTLVIDNIDNLQGAIDTLYTRKGGGIIYLTTGDYVLQNDIHHRGSVQIIGVSKDSTILDGQGVYKIKVYPEQYYEEGTFIVEQGSNEVHLWDYSFDEFHNESSIWIKDFWYEIDRVDGDVVYLVDTYEGETISGNTLIAKVNQSAKLSLLSIVNSGIDIFCCQEVNLDDIYVYDSIDKGIETRNTLYPQIYVSSWSSKYGAFLQDTYGFKVDFCDFSSCDYGFYLKDGGNGTISDTTMVLNDYNLTLDNGSEVGFISNDYSWGIQKNIYIIDSHDNHFFAGLCSGSKMGIEIIKSDDIWIGGLAVKANEIGIYIDGESSNNTISKVAYEDNEKDILDESSTTQIIISEKDIQNIELNSLLKIKKDSYTEPEKDGEKITQVNVWESDSKERKLFTRDIAYNGEEIREIITIDEITGRRLTKTLTWDSGQIINITKQYA